jgi:hypothetical protein
MRICQLDICCFCSWYVDLNTSCDCFAGHGSWQKPMTARLAVCFRVLFSAQRVVQNWGGFVAVLVGKGGRTEKAAAVSAEGKISRREKKPLTDALTHTHTHIRIGKHAANTQIWALRHQQTSATPVFFFFFFVNIYIYKLGVASILLSIMYRLYIYICSIALSLCCQWAGLFS